MDPTKTDSGVLDGAVNPETGLFEIQFQANANAKDEEASFESSADMKIRSPVVKSLAAYCRHPGSRGMDTLVLEIAPDQHD